MNWQQLPDPIKQEALTQYRKNRSLNNPALADIATDHNINIGTLLRRLQEMDRSERANYLALTEGIQLPTQSERQWNDCLVIEDENAIVISDIESPDADLVWLETVILMGIKHNIRRLIILGDTSAGDQPGLATHLLTWFESGQVDFKSSIGMLRRMIQIFLIFFDEIDIISGNHDQRIAKATGGQIDLGTFLEDFGTRVRFSRYRRMYMRTSRGLIAMYHQANFSQNGVALAQKMYDAEPGLNRQKPYAVIITHIHHWGCGKSKDNLAEVYSLGCSRDPNLTQYINETPSTFAKWSQSLIIIEDGYLRNLERDSTNWKKELGEYAEKARICAA